MVTGLARRPSSTLQLVVAMITAGSVLASRTYGQDIAPPLWTKDSIRSTVLGETRFLRIALPPGYNAKEFTADRYPVLIALGADADLGFAATVANASALGVFGPPAIPSLIIVGVETPNPSRLRDMTTPRVARALKNDSAGGAPTFLRFLSTELLPHIATRYRTLPVVVVAGHSLTGLFAAWAFGQQPDLFVGAIAISPSFPLADGVSGGEVLETVLSRKAPGRLFTAVGAAEGVGMVSSVESFASRLKTDLSPAIAFEHQLIDEASHDRSALLGMMPALQFIFRPVSLAGYEIPRLLDDDATPSQRLIEAFDTAREAYLRGAGQLGMPQRMPRAFLTNQSRSYQAPALAPLSLRICQELANSYPEMWNGHACSGDALAKMGRVSEAAASYQRAIDLARRAGEDANVDALTRKAKDLPVPK